ncbi:protein PEP-RELATED DEVELOPMENT ARRESTED 1, chloroplastic [Cornus florida]|uniref:protein PEP-RELATED DEVELOPMENT ARRESTED 1, chloroplastic n=1 Tax=Cornus florida TaxID=4283 RepID=UPI002898F08E|nr:protein PEP-RELATED DEVELOPMENT ARRESTED 1, chloroplastic [Cornus florida]XP_059626274.1 protein PEP-RELATED DEVELOPMENT ARRESTED 1, chloroplastic [Cornus florida]XP_059626275.1 protein PEP-RELATED DEVELOPMENT ARRESTED 1, chloroplastic [Cornus florida]
MYSTPTPVTSSSNLLSPPLLFFLASPSSHFPTHHHRQPKQSKNRKILAMCVSYEVGGGFSEQELRVQDRSRRREPENPKLDTAQYEALLKGGDQVTSVLEEMIKLLEDMNMDEASEQVAVELAAQGVIGKRVDQMESGFMMALDYMIQLAEKDQDDKRKSLLEVIKETVLSHLTKKCPPHVQVIGLLCRTPQKESRHELLRRVAAGGGVFQSKNGTKVQLPGANLNDIANQADDLLETMETRPVVPDRKLLARLVLIREEARNMMGGGILDERNDRGLNTLPESEVNFLTKLVALRPGRTVHDMIKNVMQGKDEGADNSGSDEESTSGMVSSGFTGRASVSGRRPLPVRPGMFLETVSKVLGGIYSGNVSGITAQHLEWVHQKTLQVLQEIAF